MYNISEIAKLFDISTNKIRFYEKKGLLNPIRQDDNDYRKFTSEDVIKIQLILLYRSIGLSIKDIESIFNNSNKENYLHHFNNQWEMINTEIHRLNTIQASLENIIDDLYEQDTDTIVNNNMLNMIRECNDLNNLKNNWKDKWNFDNWASTYDISVKEDKGALKIYKNYEIILNEVYSSVHKLNLNAPKILEIGVGTGNLASKFLASNYEIIGLDQSRDMLNVAKNKYPNLKVRLGEFLKIPYNDNTFDVIVSTYAFHHLNEIEKVIAIKEMLRVLKDSGYIVIGDLMFESKYQETLILQTLSSKQVLEIEDEYYSYIDILESEFKKFNKNISYTKIDTFNFVVVIN